MHRRQTVTKYLLIILVVLGGQPANVFNMNKVSASLESASRAVVSVKDQQDIKAPAQNKLVKLVKVDSEGRTISTELLSSSDADTFIKAQAAKESRVQIVKPVTQQTSTSKPVDVQALNRDIAQKNALDRRLANQRVNMIIDFTCQK